MFKTLASRDTQTDTQTDIKVKTEISKILSNIFYLQTVVIGGPICTIAYQSIIW